MQKKLCFVIRSICLKLHRWIQAIKCKGGSMQTLNKKGTGADSWVAVSQCSLQKALKLGVVCLIVTLVCISFLNFNKARKFYPKPKRLLPFAGSVGSDRFPSAWQQFTIPFSSLKDEQCTPAKDHLNIKGLPQIVQQWRILKCRENLKSLFRMYDISGREGSIVIDSKHFKAKVLGWLGNDTDLFKQIFKQQLIVTYNNYTKEETVFNPLRAKRPLGDVPTSELDELKRLHIQTNTSCDFCNAKRFTARDPDGRMETPLSITAANTFRYRAFHQLVMPKSHDAVAWNETQLIDMFNLSQLWLEKQVHKQPSYVFPVIDWDLLPPGGASQYHPHLQVMLTPDRYPGVVENWRRAAFDYHRDHGRNFFTDFISVHDMLGLTVRHRSAVAIATLTPKKENEVVVMAKEMNKDYLQLLYAVLRTFLDDKKLYSFTMAMALPPLADTAKGMFYTPSNAIPAFTRIISRGRLSELRSDISALEMFTFFNVNSDPFALIKEIESSVHVRLRFHNTSAQHNANLTNL